MKTNTAFLVDWKEIVPFVEVIVEKYLYSNDDSEEFFREYFKEMGGVAGFCEKYKTALGSTATEGSSKLVREVAHILNKAFDEWKEKKRVKENKARRKALRTFYIGPVKE